ncbi:MAG: serine hydrolase domain-containing protein [Streptomyces sp.]|uniref:serine hydrolase domain-containing protein n=1 Tax=Streptomyces sp. TaxID=1931 RepID=UPI003D6BCFD8
MTRAADAGTFSDAGTADAGTAADAGIAPELRAAVRGVDAPDVVFAHSAGGRRTVVTGGTGPPPDTQPRGIPREELRYEIGSASKTFTGLLLADLSQHQLVHLGDRATAHLPLPVSLPPHRHRDAVTLLHLITHTAGLPRLPRDFYPQALPHWHSNPYAGYSGDRLLRAFARSRPRHSPGSRWRYSNFGVALLGPALAQATGTPFTELLARRVLTPLGLDGTGLVPLGPGRDATGHSKDGRKGGHGTSSRLRPFDTGGFLAGGAVRATPGDLLSYLEAHLRPSASPLPAALEAVQEPLLRRGFGRAHTHTLSWIRHPTDHGPLYFHSGATMGQEAFLGFRPATGTALVALATRRYTSSSTLAPAAYRLLTAAP